MEDSQKTKNDATYFLSFFYHAFMPWATVIVASNTAMFFLKFHHLQTNCNV